MVLICLREKRFADFHIWSDGLLTTRMKWKPKQPLTLMELRCWKLQTPLRSPENKSVISLFCLCAIFFQFIGPSDVSFAVELSAIIRIPMQADYTGCFSWGKNGFLSTKSAMLMLSLEIWTR